MMRLIRGPSILAGLAGAIFLTACSPASTDDAKGGAALNASNRPPIKPTDGSATSTGQPEPSREEVWAANFGDNKQSYVAAVATALALTPNEVDAASGALGNLSFTSGEAKRSIGVCRRCRHRSRSTTSRRTSKRWRCSARLRRPMPGDAALQKTQTVEGATRLRAWRSACAGSRSGDSRSAPRVLQRGNGLRKRPSSRTCTTGNCTDVENAGAAPIYAGDPGEYSSDLDRDGDGVACEQ